MTISFGNAMSDYEKQARAYFGDAKVDASSKKAAKTEMNDYEKQARAYFGDAKVDASAGKKAAPTDAFTPSAKADTDNYRPREIGEFEEAARPETKEKPQTNPWGTGSHDIGDLDYLQPGKKLDLIV